MTVSVKAQNDNLLQPSTPVLMEPEGWMHEAWAQTPEAYAAAMAFLLSALQGTDRTILWITTAALVREHGLPYGPGLQAMGLDPARLILVRARTDIDALWAMDEGLKSNALAAVVGETEGMTLNASRRLSLTAKEHGTRCLLLVRAVGAVPSACYSRWRLAPATSAAYAHFPAAPGLPRLKAVLDKHRGGRPPQTHELEWHDATHHFRVAAPLADRPLAAPAALSDIRSAG